MPAFIAESLEIRRLLASIAWDGGGDGTSWGDRYNWGGDQLPVAGDDVSISAGAAVTVRISSASPAVSVHSITTDSALVVSGSTVSADRIEAPELSLVNGGVLRGFGCTDTEVHKLELSVSGTLSVDASSRIDVSGQGYLPRHSTGNVALNIDVHGNGSYGGMGGMPVYGDYADPQDWGSGGGDFSGGGLVRLEAGTLQLDGGILAQGAGGGFGSGSGGGIYVSASVLKGSGYIAADGGKTDAYDGRGGGGGRIAVYAEDYSGFNTSRITAAGGRGYWESTSGGAGTVYLRDPNEPHGQLIIANGALSSGYTPLGLPGQSAVTISDEVVIRGRGTYVQPDHDGLAVTFENALRVESEGHLTWKSDEIRMGEGSALTVASNGYVEVPGVLTSEGVITLDGGTLAGGRIVAPKLTLVRGGVVKSLPSTASAVYKLDISVSGTISVDSSSRIDVSGQGYLPKRTTGNVLLNIDVYGNGSYGGMGGMPVYGDYANPQDWGSGGGDSSGGGLVRLEAGTLQLDGGILAQGTGDGFGSGSGGGIDISATVVKGSGYISANGGKTDAYDGRGGGGGRVAVYVQDYSGFDTSRITAAGGRGSQEWTSGGAGTVYLRDTDEPHGQMIIAERGGSAGYTPLGLAGDTQIEIADPVLILGSNTYVTAEHDGLAVRFREGLSIRDGGVYRANGSVSADGAVEITAGARIEGSAPITIEADGVLRGTGTVNAPVIVAGVVSLAGGGPTFGSSIDVTGLGALRGSTAAYAALSGSLRGDTRNVDLYGPVNVLLNGSGTRSQPQMLEAMSRDLGALAAGLQRNFAYGTLSLGSNTYCQLVDQSHNATGAESEAVYADSLVVPAGSTLDLNGLHLYARLTQIFGTVTGGSVMQVPDSGAITPGISTSGMISPAGQLDEWTFFARRGQFATLIVNPGDGGAPAAMAPYLTYADVTLLDPAGNVLSTFAGDWRQIVSLNDVALPADGVYRIQIHAPAAQAQSTGNYVVTPWVYTQRIAPLVLDQLNFGQIDTPHSADQWAFSATAGQQVQFRLAGTTGGVGFTLNGPDGWQGFADLTADSGLTTLPAAGGYSLVARGTGGQYASAYSFRLEQTAQVDLPLNTEYAANLAGGGQAQLFRFTLREATPFLVRLDDSSGVNINELYLKFGAPPTRADYDYRYSRPAEASQEILVPTAEAGTWYALLYAESVPAPGPCTITAKTSDLLVTSVTPDRIGNATAAQITINGAGFGAGSEVQLIDGQGMAFSADVESYTWTALTASIDLTRLPAGVYDVKVTSSGTIAELPAGLTLLQGGTPRLETHLVVPAAMGFNIPVRQVIWVEYANTGTVPMPAPLLEVHGDHDVRITADPALAIPYRGFDGAPAGVTDTVEVIGIGSSATPWILQPGESGRIPIYYIGLGKEWWYPQITFTVGALTADDTRPIDWAQQEALIRPKGPNDVEWATMYRAIQIAVGPTWGGYVRATASELQREGLESAQGASVTSAWSSLMSAASSLLPTWLVQTFTDYQRRSDEVDYTDIPLLDQDRSWSDACREAFNRVWFDVPIQDTAFDVVQAKETILENTIYDAGFVWLGKVSKVVFNVASLLSNLGPLPGLLSQIEDAQKKVALPAEAASNVKLFIEKATSFWMAVQTIWEKLTASNSAADAGSARALLTDLIEFHVASMVILESAREVGHALKWLEEELPGLGKVVGVLDGITYLGIGIHKDLDAMVDVASKVIDDSLAFTLAVQDYEARVEIANTHLQKYLAARQNDGDPGPNDGDSDGDGIPDDQDNDADNDGLTNDIDDDDDGDGIPDGDEGNPAAPVYQLPKLSIGDAAAVEGDPGDDRALRFKVSMSAPSDQDVVFSWRTAQVQGMPADQTATEGSDYTGGGGQVTIPAGQTETTLIVPIVGDKDDEQNEVFQVILTIAPGVATIARQKARGTIMDDDDASPPPGPGLPPLPPYGPNGASTAPAAGSFDPNDKIGTAGFGAGSFVRGGADLSYCIDFENDARATAPAKEVVVDDQLDADLDWSTFRLTEIAFGSTNIAVPAGAQHFQATVPIVYNGQSFVVLVEAGIRSDTGRVYATFQSIDPESNLPLDVLTGFLPPEDGTGRGQGHISYTVQLKSGLATGTQVRNVALITFDANEAIATDQIDPHDASKGIDPAKDCLNTVDSGAPASSVAALPATASAADFLVQWSGQDDAGGSGVGSYDIYVSTDGGPFLTWLSGTTLSEKNFAGAPGHTYAFYSIGRDNVGNVEAVPAVADAQVQVAWQGTGGDDHYTLRLDATGQNVEFLQGDSAGVAAFVQPRSSLVIPLKINGLGGNDVLTIDLTNGNPIPLGGIILDGGEGTDRMIIMGGSSADAISINGSEIHCDGLPAWANDVETVGIADGSSLRLSGLAIGLTDTVDLGSGGMVLTHRDGDHGAAKVEQLRAWIRSALVGGGEQNPWSGTGLTSTAARDNVGADTAIAVFNNDDGEGNPWFDTFNGIPVDQNSIILKYTYFGDSNIDGRITGDDFAAATTGWFDQMSGIAPTWMTGDYNYDQKVTGDDFALVTSSWFSQDRANPLSAGAVVPVVVQQGGESQGLLASTQESASTVLAAPVVLPAAKKPDGNVLLVGDLAVLA